MQGLKKLYTFDDMYKYIFNGLSYILILVVLISAEKGKGFVAWSYFQVRNTASENFLRLFKEITLLSGVATLNSKSF